MGFIGLLVSIIYKTLFLSGDSGYRLAHTYSKLVLIASMTAILVFSPRKTIFIIPLIVVLGLISPGLDWVIASITLSGLAGFYLSISAYLLSLTGLYSMDLFKIIEVAARTTGISLSFIFMFTIISPIEIHDLLYYLKGRRACVIPLLLWRLIPYSLRNFMDSLAVGYLKKEKTFKRRAPASASMIETGRFIEDYCYARLETESKTSIQLPRNTKYSILLIIASLILILIKILLNGPAGI